MVFSSISMDIMGCRSKITSVLLVLILTVLVVVKGLQGRSCLVDGTPQCCKNNFNNNGICEACPNGFESNDGIKCSPCKNGLYGKNCADQCHCPSNYQCHHVTGACIEETSEEITEHEIKTKVVTAQDIDSEFSPENKTETTHANDIICPPGYTLMHRILCMPCPEGLYGLSCANICRCDISESCNHVKGCVASTIFTASTPDFDVSSESFTTLIADNNDKGIPNLMFLIGLCVTLMIGCFISLLLNRIRKKCTRRGNKNPFHDSFQRFEDNGTQEYQYIDELHMGEFSSKTPEIVNRNMKSEDKEIDKADCSRANYLDPYYLKQPVMSEYHKDHRKNITDNKSILNKDGYLNPYNQLVQSSREDNHTYRMCITNTDTLTTTSDCDNILRDDVLALASENLKNDH